MDEVQVYNRYKNLFVELVDDIKQKYYHKKLEKNDFGKFAETQQIKLLEKEDRIEENIHNEINFYRRNYRV